MTYGKAFEKDPLRKYQQIETDKEIEAILSYDLCICNTPKPISITVIKRANTILPDLNRIVFDWWDQHVGHLVCLPIQINTYRDISKQIIFEGDLTLDTIIDITALGEGVFYLYAVFGINNEVAVRLIRNAERYLSKIDRKEKYLVAGCAVTLEARAICNKLGMTIVSENVKDFKDLQTEIVPTVYQIELDRLMSHVLMKRPR